MRWFQGFAILIGAAALLAATDQARSISLVFEREPRVLFAGRSPKFLARGAHGLRLLSVRPASGGGQDLFLETSGDGGDTFAAPLRVNQAPAEVSDHGENSPQLAESPDGHSLYAVWSSRDPKRPFVGAIRFARSPGMTPAFSPAITINDDDLPVSHSFQGMGVGPDGVIYVAWLDGREHGTGHGGGHAPLATLYVARSTDHGRSFEKNVRVAGDICPCCRVAVALVGDRVVLGWRSVESGDIRDMFVAASSDKGQTWSRPVLVARDGWKLNGCPHVGPGVAALGSRLYVAWYSEGGGDPAIYLASSPDGGRTFSGKKKVSGETVDPTHPQLVSNGEKLALVFQGRSAQRDQGWGRVGVYYREIYPDGATSQLERAGDGKSNAAYPAVELGMSGRIFLGWTETTQGVSTGYLLRGRSAAVAAKTE